MARKPRIDVGGEFYHVLNRVNARVKILFTDKEYLMLEKILCEAKSRFNMRIIAYCLMPNHFHLILYPLKDGDMQKFMHWITFMHAQLWHKEHGTTGTGHLYQGRYKSFLIKDSRHLMAELVYVERNPVRAKLVDKAIHWRFSSARHRFGSKNKLITDIPIEFPENYKDLLNDNISLRNVNGV
ncbi:MAG TPA: transposase [Candidatus Paceibacterota bacterium]|jgi:putative transposase|nr:transposase [Candidatus Paceibacterota bacterium]